MYTFHGVVPCIAVTVPLTGNVTDVVIYDCMGCGNEVTETVPVIGNVALVETYVTQGTVPCSVVTAPPEIETVPVIGRVVEVAIYDVHGEVPCKAVTAPDIGKVADVDMYVFQGTVP
jgi:hypothetical protein